MSGLLIPQSFWLLKLIYHFEMIAAFWTAWKKLIFPPSFTWCKIFVTA
jgi:hypothetical protein